MSCLLIALSKFLGCEVQALNDYMNHPSVHKKIEEFLKDKKLRTTYMSRSMEQKEIKFGGLSNKGANVQHAYEGFLNV